MLVLVWKRVWYINENFNTHKDLLLISLILSLENLLWVVEGVRNGWACGAPWAGIAPPCPLFGDGPFGTM